MEKNHRQRLIEEGLYEPLTPNDIAERKELLERRARGEKIQDPPIYCVYRADDPWTHIDTSLGKKCQDAELIADHLRGYEAQSLCSRLCIYDKQQPPRTRPWLPPLDMYRISKMDDWDAWEAQHAQLRMEV
ncbi:MAG: hypothetical protein IKY92_03630 [Akkermansia sp.]|nr:hypothetical protein [Akkermansia sp.]